MYLLYNNIGGIFLIRGLLCDIERHHHETAQHCLRTAHIAASIGDSFFPEEETKKLARVMMIHDYGKIFIPVSLLDKDGPLTDNEKKLMDTHSKKGADALILKGISSSEANLVALHHTKKDASMSDEVAFISVIDVFDALVSPRAYKEAFPIRRALKILKDMFKNVHFAKGIINKLEEFAA